VSLSRRYVLLKQAVKQGNPTHMVDIMAATNVDYPSTEILLQRAFLMRAEAFGVQDRRTEASIKR
jgi:hypothetical protein